MIDSYLKGSAFTVVKKYAKFYTRYVKGVPFVNRKGAPFSQKMIHKWAEGVEPGGGASPNENWLINPPPPPLRAQLFLS